MNTGDGKVDRKSSRMGHQQFDEIFNQHKNAIYSFACHLTQDRGEAEDLFQETWLRVAQHFPKVLDMKRVKSWLFTIAANLHKDGLRKKRVRRRFIFQKRWETSLNQIDGEAVPDRGNSEALNESERVEMGLAISHALSRLPEKYRLIFVLKEIGGFKQEEIAKMLNIPIGTVKSLMFRAVKRLRQDLADYHCHWIKQKERGTNEMQRC